MSPQLSYVEGGPPQCSPFPVAENRTGGGGGLYSDPEVEKKTSSSSSGEEDREAAIASTLRDLGLFLLAPPKRWRIARELAAAGITPEQLLELAAFVAESEADEARRRRYLAAVVANADVAAMALRDVQHYRTKAGPARPAAAAAAAKPASEHDGGAALRAANMESVRRFEAEFQAAVARGEVTTARDPHPWERR